MATREFDFRNWVGRGARLLAGGALAGMIVGIVLTVGLSLYGEGAAFGTRKSFALGALVLGFAVLGWSGSIIAGRGVENLQRHLDSGSGWTEADSRRAMARIAGFGAGVMLSVSLIEVIVS